MKTYSAKPAEIKRKWLVIDATDVVLGRLAAEVAMLLRGRHKPEFTPHVDCGDHVIIINAEKVHLTGKKLDNDVFYWHTGFPGGVKEINPRKTLEGRFPARLIERAVERMIARRRAALANDQLAKLHVYAGSEHPHAAQKPEVYDFASKNRKNKKSESEAA